MRAAHTYICTFKATRRVLKSGVGAKAKETRFDYKVKQYKTKQKKKTFPY